MAFKVIPKSLALIPDGNRRWARANKYSVFGGYDVGVKKFIDFVEWCSSYGINNVTVWALSSENLSRPKNELKALFNIYRKVTKDKGILERLQTNGIKVKIVGHKENIPKDLSASLKKVEDDTAENKEGTVNMLIGYGGRDDIMSAARRIVQMAAEGKKFDEGIFQSSLISPDALTVDHLISAEGRNVDERVFQSSLMSHDIPNIDYVIRTSGEQRLSGFMPWQTGYSELYFTKKLWPDFTKRDLHAALSEYEKRQRRFGK